MAPSATDKAIADLTVQVAAMNESVTKATEQIAEFSKTMKGMQEGLNLNRLHCVGTRGNSYHY